MRNQVIELRDGWQLTHHDGYGQFVDDGALPEVLPHLVWIPAHVPGSVYADLARAGWIDDVRWGCNSLAAQWVEHQYWFYRTAFAGAPLLAARELGARCFLQLDGLDGVAVVYLNSQPVAEHANAFRPVLVDITDRIRDGQNDLLIRLESGLISRADYPHGDYHLEVSAFATKRAWLRKPQFLSRWDWAPRLLSVGIAGSVAIRICQRVWLEHVVVIPEWSGTGGAATLHVRARVVNVTGAPQSVGLHCHVRGTSAHVETHGVVSPGAGALECDLVLRNPELWWPRPLGKPTLYEVETALLVDGQEVQNSRGTVGIRRVRLDQEPTRDGGRRFQIVVNDVPVFCKGANWVPVDILYSAAPDSEYERLVNLATECGCNLLRIWGGGHYAHERFLDACDRAGVLVWHDLMFACSKYPGDNPEFVREVEAEVRYQVRRLASHPSLILWCGNNEVSLGIQDGWIRSRVQNSRPCDDLFFCRLADIVQQEDGSRPYWPTSPWSPDGAHPNHPLTGDQHPWIVSLGPAKGDYWHYRTDASRFPNEGGMLGPSTFKTLSEILAPEERRIGSRTWLHHDNTQNTWRGESLLDHLLRVNLCANPRDLAFAEYAHYGAILQGEALETAIDNWRRRKFDTSAAVFWMFHDAWPAATSWSIVDYARRRKPAFWYVKRAFADLRAISVVDGAEVVIYVVNDLPNTTSLTLCYGLFGLAGGRPLHEARAIECPPNAAIPAARWPLSVWDQAGRSTHGAFAILVHDNTTVCTHRLFRARFGELCWSVPQIQLTREKGYLRFSADAFAWAVCIDPDGELPLEDNYFDLIPGMERVVAWRADWPTPRVRAANPCSPGNIGGATGA